MCQGEAAESMTQVVASVQGVRGDKGVTGQPGSLRQWCLTAAGPQLLKQKRNPLTTLLSKHSEDRLSRP